MSKGKYIRDKSLPTVCRRFWEKVSKTDTCWLWTAAKYRNGYGVFYIPWIGNQSAQRAAWILERGPIPEGLFVLHTCDNPPCVNPDHLFLGTPKQNTEDMVRKGRSTAGEKHRRAKLKAIDVVEIRRLHHKGCIQSDVAEQYGVSCATVNNIVKRKTWNCI